MIHSRKKLKSQRARMTNKMTEISKNKLTVPDVYSLRHQKVCGKNFDLYFNGVFASSNYFVYSLCKDPKLSQCKETLAKVYKMKRKSNESVEQEAEYMRAASDLGVSPRFLGLEYCQYNGVNYAILIMSHYGQGSLTQLLSNGYYDANKTRIDRHLRVILDTLYDNNIDHNDLHSDNFLYRIKKGRIKFKIIDFDNTVPLLKKRNYIIENTNNFKTIRNGKSISRPGKDIDLRFYIGSPSTYV